MSEIDFGNFNSNYFNSTSSTLFFDGFSSSGSAAGSGDLTSMISDYSSIKNGSYNKLLKAYYAKQDLNASGTTSEESKKLTLLKSSADNLKKSADALNDKSLFEKN